MFTFILQVQMRKILRRELGNLAGETSQNYTGG